MEAFIQSSDISYQGSYSVKKYKVKDIAQNQLFIEQLYIKKPKPYEFAKQSLNLAIQLQIYLPQLEVQQNPFLYRQKVLQKKIKPSCNFTFKEIFPKRPSLQQLKMAKDLQINSCIQRKLDTAYDQLIKDNSQIKKLKIRKQFGLVDFNIKLTKNNSLNKLTKSQLNLRKFKLLPQTKSKRMFDQRHINLELLKQPNQNIILQNILCHLFRFPLTVITQTQVPLLNYKLNYKKKLPKTLNIQVKRPLPITFKTVKFQECKQLIFVNLNSPYKHLLVDTINLPDIQEIESSLMHRMDLIIGTKSGVIVKEITNLQQEQEISFLIKNIINFCDRFEKIHIILIGQSQLELQNMKKIIALQQLARNLNSLIFFEFCLTQKSFQVYIGLLLKNNKVPMINRLGLITWELSFLNTFPTFNISKTIKIYQKLQQNQISINNFIEDPNKLKVLGLKKQHIIRKTIQTYFPFSSHDK